MGSAPDTAAAEMESVAHRLAARRFPELSRALHTAIPATVRRWRTRSLEAMPLLDTLTVAEFENSIAATLHLLASALECDDPARLDRLLAESPAHGLLRFLQHFGPETLLAEERILRSALVIELRRELGRAPTPDEAAALHDLLDLMAEQSLLALIQKRGEQDNRNMQTRMGGLHRMADLGMLVAGVAHDASNLLLPLRMRLEHLEGADLSSSVRDDLTSVVLIVKQLQNLIVNLRWLSVDSGQGAGVGAGAPPSRFARPPVSLGIREWADEAVEFHRRLLPREINLDIDIAPALPPVAIPSAALSQAVFNLIHNARQAIASAGESVRGRIVLRATAGRSGTVDIAIEDDGPGMSEEVLRRSTEPFFTTRADGSGLGLAVVEALLTGCGGSLKCYSPPPGGVRGTAVVMTVRTAGAL